MGKFGFKVQLLSFLVMGFVGCVSSQIQAPQNTEPVIAYGQATSFLFHSHAEDAMRVNLIYLPKSIDPALTHAQPDTKYKTLMFLHGGGTDSTATVDDAVSVAQRYLRDLTDYAEKNQVILVLPTTAQGWASQTSYFFREFIPFIEKRLPIDDDHFVLAGHSMGGMGITREYPYTTDLFSGVLGMAAGIQDAMMNENAILPYFNGTPYIEMNGESDMSFPDFITQAQKFQNELNALTAKVGFAPSFQLVTFAGGHRYDVPSMYARLDELFAYSKVRDPKYFTVRFGIYHGKSAPGYVGHLPTPKIDGVLDHQYWISIGGYEDTGVTAFIVLHVKVTGQTIAINTDANQLHPRKITLKLDSNLVDLAQPVSVVIDGASVFSGTITGSELTLSFP